MERRIGRKRAGRRLLAASAGVLAVCVVAVPAGASEAVGDLDLRVEILAVEPAPAPGVEPVTGSAAIRATLQAVREVSDLRFEIVVREISASPVLTRTIDSAALRWRKGSSGDPCEPGDAGTAMGPLEMLSTRFALPLAKRGIYEVTVRAAGESASGPVSTEAMAVVEFGASLPRPSVVDGVAEYQAQEGRGVGR